jgi:hypothetical protein
MTAYERLIIAANRAQLDGFHNYAAALLALAKSIKS